MIRKILQNEVRKDLRRANNHNNHREYLRALNPVGKLNYLARYHKKIYHIGQWGIMDL